MSQQQILKDFLLLQLQKDELSFQGYFQIIRRMTEVQINSAMTPDFLQRSGRAS